MRPDKFEPSRTDDATGLSDPLIFDTFYRPQVWGGRGLNRHLGRMLPDDRPYGEAWDLSPQPLHVSRVIEGPLTGRSINELWADRLGESSCRYGHKEFPLLIKWLECRELLSLQVHPDDQMARTVLNEPYGKSEAWVVIAAEPAARIFAGLKPGVTRSDVIAHLNAGTLIECLHSFAPKPGDCVSLPAGSIHAAGGGLVIAEVQQSSDATFRLFDWNRVGLDGVPRALHIDRAMEATNWNQGPISPIIPVAVDNDSRVTKGEILVEGNGFRLERYITQSPFPSANAGELTIWMVLDGQADLSNPSTGYRRRISKGETALIPATASGIVWHPVATGQSLTLLCVRLSTDN